MSDVDGDMLNQIERFLRWFKIALSIVAVIGGWALGLTYWLVEMHSEVDQLKRDHEIMRLQFQKVDETGTRALEVIRNRQTDVIAINQAQEIQLRDLRQTQLENRLLIEQLRAAISTFSHPRLPPP